MFKKWFILCTAVFIFAAVILSAVLTRQFTQKNPGVSGPRDDGAAVEATAPPREASLAKLQPVVLIKGRQIDPMKFLSDATPSNVVAFFSEETDSNLPGINEAVLTLSDGTKREDATVTMYVIETVRSVKIEAGVKASKPAAADFIANANILPPEIKLEVELLTEMDETDTYEAGNYNVELLINGVRANSTLQVADTTPPAATPAGFDIGIGQKISPQDFVTDIIDFSPVTVTYLEGFEPNVLLPGEHLVTVVLEDAYGNKSNYNSMLKVQSNTVPPAFEGLKNLEAFLGDPVMYRMGVTARDSFGNELDYEVDSEAVDITTPGSYPVKYSAADADGNKTEEEIIITVSNITEEDITEDLNLILDAIFEDGMTQYEQARAIFNWISSNVGYVSDSPKNSVYEGAYRALTQRSGDCFTFYAIAEVMLTGAGIPNERVTRVEGTPSRHYWNLVNADGAGWYHFDSTPSVVHSIDRFMFTDGDAFSYTGIIRSETGSREYYTYDKTLHPEVVQ